MSKKEKDMSLTKKIGEFGTVVKNKITKNHQPMWICLLLIIASFIWILSLVFVMLDTNPGKINGFTIAGTVLQLPILVLILFSWIKSTAVSSVKGSRIIQRLIGWSFFFAIANAICLIVLCAVPQVVVEKVNFDFERMFIVLVTAFSVGGIISSIIPAMDYVKR